MIAAFAPDRNAFLPLSDKCVLPPARRIKASGRIKRNMAIVFNISSSLNGLLFS